MVKLNPISILRSSSSMPINKTTTKKTTIFRKNRELFNKIWRKISVKVIKIRILELGLLNSFIYASLAINEIVLTDNK